MEQAMYPTFHMHFFHLVSQQPHEVSIIIISIYTCENGSQ